MSNSSRLLVLAGMLLFSLFTAPIASADYADPPERVAHLNHIQGQVSYSPAGEDEWFGAVRNRPLIRGDRLWTDYAAFAEFQVGSAAIRIGSNTSVDILDLSDSIAQFQMTQGSFNLSVRRMYPGQILEIDTPTLALTIDRPGRYRIDVDPGSNATTIGVWDGAGTAYGENANFPLRSGDTVRFYSADLRDYEMVGVPPEDDFDHYCIERDRLLASAASLRYIDDDVAGYTDLDAYGYWRPVRNYGAVWFPSRVDADWAPYRDGHWVWQEPWGWTWVDDAPWGFAPSHYGRWVYVANRWGWVPGPRHVRPVYAPALVAFVGDRGWSESLSIGDSTPIGWFPLGPREVYVPSYHASRDYFTRVNVNNTVVNNTTITNVYNNYSSGAINVREVNYVNRRVAGAVTAVPRSVFVNAQPVRQAAIRLDRQAVASGEVTRIAPIAPNVHSVTGDARVADTRPSREAFDRKVFARNAPPPVERPFAAREQQLQKNPGRAPEPRETPSVQSRDTKTLPNLRVIGEQPGSVDVRAAGSRRSGVRPSATPGQLRPLDRPAEAGTRSGPVTGDQTRDKVNKGQGDAQQEQRQFAAPQQTEQRQAAPQQLEQRQVVPQQQEQRQFATPPQTEQRQAVPQQQEQRQDQAAKQRGKAAKTPQEQRQAECERQAILQHRDPHECMSKTQPQNPATSKEDQRPR